MAPPYINIFYTNGSFEPSNKWFLYNPITSPVAAASTALGIADACCPLQHETVTYTRWEYVAEGGVKTFEGAFSPGLVGQVLGEQLPFKYCVLIRLASTGAARPSVKYFHGLGESSIAFGNPSPAYITDIGTAGLAWAALDVCDSDRSNVEGAIFRSFTRRKKVRRAG